MRIINSSLCAISAMVSVTGTSIANSAGLVDDPHNVVIAGQANAGVQPNPKPNQVSVTGSFASIDFRRVATESVYGKSLLQKVEQLAQLQESEIAPLRQQVEKQRKQLQDSRSVVSTDALRDSERSLQKVEVELKRKVEDAQKELRAREQLIEQDLLLKIREIVDEIAQEAGFHGVFDLANPNLLWSEPAVDISGTVIERLDRDKKLNKH
jgi:Skp family chaperone for outer membrane proteins